MFSRIKKIGIPLPWFSSYLASIICGTNPMVIGDGFRQYFIEMRIGARWLIDKQFNFSTRTTNLSRVFNVGLFFILQMNINECLNTNEEDFSNQPTCNVCHRKKICFRYDTCVIGIEKQKRLWVREPKRVCMFEMDSPSISEINAISCVKYFINGTSFKCVKFHLHDVQTGFFFTAIFCFCC